jgi:hypothetical protein
MDELTGMELVKSLELQGQEIFNKNPGAYPVAENTTKCLFNFIYKYQEVVPELNTAKAKLDTTYLAKDSINFEKSLDEFKTAFYKLYEVKRALKSRRKMKHLKIHKELLNNALNKIASLEHIVTSSEHWLKRAGMTEKQRNAADATSQRMRMMWGL